MRSTASLIRSRAALSSPTSGSTPQLPPADAAVLELEHAWAVGQVPSVEEFWGRFAPDGSVEVLSALIKADLRCRFRSGDRPVVSEYLERFAALRAARERVVSLVYEEYCLLEEQGQRPDPERFCDRYDPWRDSLLSQLRYHQMLSQAAGVTPSPSRLPSPGDRFRGFRLHQVLGEGGSARVFLASEELLGDRKVALKVSTDRGKEPAIQGRLNHEHIVKVLSVVDDPESGLRGLCMPYCAGLPLDEVIRRVDPASRPRRAEVFRQAIAGLADPDAPAQSEDSSWQGFPDRGTYVEGVAWVVSVVAKALAYAHSRGVLHRDVKPANVLLTRRNGPQLLDFNLAHAPHAADQAEAALRGGTLPYMAPEQLAAFLDPERWNDVREPADIYAVGLLLRELLTGRRPPAHDPSAPLPRALRELLDLRFAGLAPARTLNPDVPHALDAILSRCLAIRPEDRYTALELAAALRRIVPHRRPTARGVALSAIGVGVAFMALGTVWTLREDASRAPVYVNMAKEYLKSNNLKEARREIDRAVALDPQLWTAYWWRAQLHGKMGNYPAAVRDDKRAVELTERPGRSIPASDRSALHLHLGKVYNLSLQTKEAEAAFVRATKLNPKDYQPLDALAMIAENAFQHDRALAYLDQAITLAKSSSNWVGPEQIGNMYRRRAFSRTMKGNTTQPLGAAELDDRTKASLRDAEAFYLSAKRDVREAWDFLPTPSMEDAFKLEWVEARIEIGLGDVAAHREEKAIARRHYERAKPLLNRAKLRPIDRQTIIQRLSSDIESRLNDPTIRDAPGQPEELAEGDGKPVAPPEPPRGTPGRVAREPSRGPAR